MLKLLIIVHNSKQQQRNPVLAGRGIRYNENDTGNSHNSLSWPQFYYHRTRVNNVNNNNSGGSRPGEEQLRGSAGTGRKDVLGASGSPSAAALQRVLCPDEARVMQRANQIVMYVPAHTHTHTLT